MMAYLNTAGDILKFVSLLLIDFLAFFGNSIMIMAGIRSTELKKFSNGFIFNMASADLLQSVMIMPFCLASVYYGQWPLSTRSCTVIAVFKVAITLVSVQSLAGISLDRYYYVVKSRHTFDSRKRAAMSILAVWVISMLLSVAPLFGWGELGFDTGKEICTVLFYKSVSYTSALFGVGLFVPLGVMAICYYKIFIVLRLQGLRLTKTKRIENITVNITHTVLNGRSCFTPVQKLCLEELEVLPDSNGRNQLVVGEGAIGAINIVNVKDKKDTTAEQSESKDKDLVQSRRGVDVQTLAGFTENKVEMKTKLKGNYSSKELHLLRTVTLVIVVFISCWFPYVVVNFLTTIKVLGRNKTVDTVNMWMGFANSALNPILYGLTNRQFRNAVKKVIRPLFMQK